MPPERDIETMLKAAAEKRRREAGAAWELHPATRRLLQGEVARQYRTPPRAAFAWRDLLARQRWRIAWAAGLTAVLGLGLWISLPRPARNPAVGDVASMEKRLAERALRPARPEPAATSDLNRPAATTAGGIVAVTQPVTAPKLAFEEARADVVAVRKVSSLPVAGGEPGREATNQVAIGAPAESSTAALAPAPAPGVNGSEMAFAKARAFQRRYGAAQPAEQAPAGATGEAMQDRLSFNSPLAPAAAPASAPTATAGNVSFGYFARTPAAGSRLAQNFDRLAKDASAISGPMPPAPAVLENFRLERAGDVVAITDRDGSTYTGRVQPPPAAIAALADGTASRDKLEAAQELQTVNGVAPGSGAPVKMRSRQAATALAVPSEVSRDSFSFHAAGTNRTLHQQVVFDGAVVFAPASPVAAAGAAQPTGTVTATSARSESVRAPAAVAPFQNLRVTGKAVVGGRPAVEINAVPVKR